MRDVNSVPLTCGSCWVLIPRAPFECPARSTFVGATPLLEKERRALFTTGISQLFNPPWFHWSRTWAGLAAYDCPMHT